MQVCTKKRHTTTVTTTTTNPHSTHSIKSADKCNCVKIYFTGRIESMSHTHKHMHTNSKHWKMVPDWRSMNDFVFGKFLWFFISSMRRRFDYCLYVYVSTSLCLYFKSSYWCKWVCAFVVAAAAAASVCFVSSVLVSAESVLVSSLRAYTH